MPLPVKSRGIYNSLGLVIKIPNNSLIRLYFNGIFVRIGKSGAGGVPQSLHTLITLQELSRVKVVKTPPRGGDRPISQELLALGRKNSLNCGPNYSDLLWLD